MSRITDAERIVRLLTDAGGSLGRQEIVEQLGLSEDRYQVVADALVDDEVVTKNRGRTGGLRLLEATPARKPGRPRGPSPDTAAGIRTRRLKGTEGFAIPLFELQTATPESLADLVKRTPNYKPHEFRRLVENTVGAIHQIPFLFYGSHREKYELKQIEAYFGRSSAGTSHLGMNLFQRFLAGVDRGHDYGMIFAATSIAESLKYERHGIRLIERLRDSDGLCISNTSSGAVGRVGTTEPGFLYMTFRILEEMPEPAHELTDAEMDRIIRERRRELRAEPDPGNDDAAEGFEVGVRLANDPRHTGRRKLAWQDDAV